MRNFLAQPIVVVVTRRQIHDPPQVLEHLRLMTKFRLASCQVDARLSFVVVKSARTEILERGEEFLARRLTFPRRNPDSSTRQRRCEHSRLVISCRTELD